MEKPKTKIELNYSRVADKFFKEHPEIKEKFKENLKNFYVNSEKNVDIKIIKGIKPTQYRMRIGKYRIIFYVNKEKILLYSIFVEKADSRGEIYKK
ncbi:type II toxin-antitoxin system RelE family toxin [Fusobacterium polymorphum]|uniref:type II toxin-antitoxin system RelE family toxin n=1 Tax=Fusobacterium nucleatum subsp. polymorphum TaxID=76857 RepID=UPI00300913FA